MAENSPTNTDANNDGNNMSMADAEMILGMSVLGALGGAGEVYGRRNSLYARPTFLDALGLTGNRFNFVPTTTQPTFTMGMDMRTILGGNADVVSTNPDSRFAQNMMAALMGGGIFGLLFAVGEYNAELDERAKQERQQQNRQGGQQPTVSGTGEISNASGTTTTLRPPDGAEASSPSTTTPGPAAGATATTTATAGNGTISVPDGAPTPPGAVCEAPSVTTGSRLCVINRPKI